MVKGADYSLWDSPIFIINFLTISFISTGSIIWALSAKETNHLANNSWEKVA